MLKAGVIHQTRFDPTESGTPQGGIISPLLANFVLDGLEDKILKALDSATLSRDKKLTISRRDKTKTTINLKPVICRYADDIVIITRSRNIALKYIKPTLNEFLKERGLTLSENKTKIFTMKEDDLEFLGYQFMYKKD